MTKQVQRRRGTATQHTSFTGADGETSVNTTNKSIHVHDGSTVGGFEAARIDLTNVTGATVAGKVTGSTLSSLTITSADINGGTIDSTAIGNTTPSSGLFTTLNASSTLTLGGTAVTSTAAELNILDGVTATAAELNVLDGVTATAAELNLVDGSAAGSVVINKAVIYSATGQVNATQLAIGGTAITSTAAELNFVDGVTSNVQTQINTKVAKAGDTMTGNLSFGGNNKAIFGASSDLQIYHDGSSSIIADVGTGNLQLRANDFQLLDAGNTKNIIRGYDATGAVGLHYGGGEKLATTATGIDVTGTVVADGLTVDGSAVINQYLTLKTTDDQVNGWVLYTGTTDKLEFNYNGSGNAEVVIDSTGNVGIGTTAPATALSIVRSYTGGSDTGYPHIYLNNTAAQGNGSTTFNQAMLRVNAGDGAVGFLRATYDSAGPYGTSIDLWSVSNIPLRFATNNTERMRIDSSGNVGIGTSSPSTYGGKLHVASAGSTQTSIMIQNPGIGSGHIGFDASSSNIKIYNTYATGLLANGAGIDITSSGNVGIGTSSPAANSLTLENKYLSFSNSQTKLGDNGIVTGAEADGNTRLEYYNGKYFTIAMSATERMRIDSSGNVGIGTSSPSTELHVVASNGYAELRLQGASGSSGSLEFYDSTTKRGDIFVDTSSNIIFRNTAEAMRIDSSGNVGIGTVPTANNISKSISLVNGGSIFGYGNGTYITANSNYNGAWNTVATGADSRMLLDGNVIFSRSASASAGTAGAVTESMRIDSSGNVGIGTTSPVSNLDVKGSNSRIRWDLGNAYTYQGATNSAGSAFAAAYYDGSEHRWLIASSTKAMIDSSGNLLVGATSGGSKIVAEAVPSGTTYLAKWSATGGTALYLEVGGSAVGSISCTASATSYNTSSDYRLKENVVGMSGATERLKQLKPSRFNFIADADTTVDGFLAHEVQDIVPEAITGNKDAVDADGNPEYQGIDQSKLVPLLTAALQEALTEISALKVRVTALEG